MSRPRLDLWLVEQGYFSSPQQAQRSIQAGDVFLDGIRVDKPGIPVPVHTTIQVKTSPPFVSRGGEKLAAVLQEFPVFIEDRVCLDSGISTGGFTDCLLQRGARHVYGVDVGYGQVAWSLQTDPRVTIRERTNLRYLTPEQLYGATDPWPTLATVDVSFISLSKILPALWSLLHSPREVLLLVKPQFEAQRQQVGKNGVVRDPLVHTQVIHQVLEPAITQGWQFRGLTWSRVVGPAGNIEYWLWMQDSHGDPSPDHLSILSLTQAAAVALTHP